MMVVTYKIEEGKDGHILTIFENGVPVLRFQGYYGMGFGGIEVIWSR